MQLNDSIIVRNISENMAKKLILLRITEAKLLACIFKNSATILLLYNKSRGKSKEMKSVWS
jgi:hypothetical protein